MTDRFVGIGGNDGNSGLTWALRKLTLNGAEDTPVVAGDTIYVGPGTYREVLTVDVSGAGGNIITYIGDVTGENTDGVGGAVRVTGSDNDTTSARANCILANGRDYRTFRGFRFDMSSGRTIRLTSCETIIIEDCVFDINDNADTVILVEGADQLGTTVRRCLFMGGSILINFSHSVAVDDANHLVENCIGIHSYGGAIETLRVGGITVRNCMLFGGANRGACIKVSAALTAGQTVDVNNCLLLQAYWGLSATVVGEVVENYNAFWGNNIDRNNVNVGGNSNLYPPLFSLPILFDGIIYPWWIGELSEWSQIARITGTGVATDDLRGIIRPTTAAKISWGPVQLREGQRETGTVRGGSTASMNLADAGDHQIFVPVDAVQMTISVYVYREANYAGTNPRMIVRQPGQADDVTTDAGGAAGWNLLTTTLTPSADTDYVIVILRSLNTAAAGNYDVFFDDLQVT